MSKDRKKVVIVGGGFGGLQAARKLGKSADHEVLLIDRRNHHLFQPLLYQVAMAGLAPNDIAVPIRSLLSEFKNTRVILGNVEHLALDEQKVLADCGEFSYDYLILACGAKHSYFGNEHWEDRAPGLKTLEQAVEIRRRILTAFEMAERNPSTENIKKQLTFIVIGGGPTGVELAGAIGELSRFTLAKDFKKIQPSHSRVILIEAGERILSGFTPFLSNKATRSLEKLGVQVWTRSPVTEVVEDGVRVGAEFVEASTVLWAAGVQPSSLNKELPAQETSKGLIKVEADLSLKAHPNVFVIGDQSLSYDMEGKPLPGLAPVAIQQGRYVADLLIAEGKNKERRPFRYKDKGQMATIGRKMAVLESGPLKLWGFIAWAAWLVVHIYYLIGFRNRFFVFLHWTWNYLTYSRGARLITDRNWRSYRKTSN